MPRRQNRRNRGRKSRGQYDGIRTNAIALNRSIVMERCPAVPPNRNLEVPFVKWIRLTSQFTTGAVLDIVSRSCFLSDLQDYGLGTFVPPLTTRWNRIQLLRGRMWCPLSTTAGEALISVYSIVNPDTYNVQYSAVVNANETNRMPTFAWRWGPADQEATLAITSARLVEIGSSSPTGQYVTDLLVRFI
jgi:hypothetical protein